MVKFSKQLEGQLVSEWRAAYVNYKLLKKELNRLRSAAPRRVSDSPVFAMHALTRRRTTIHPSAKPAIVVRNVDSSGTEEEFQTELLEKLANDDDAKVFFRRLDAEFNKVNRFYKSKEDEFLQRAAQLDKQIHTLLQLKNLVQEQGFRYGVAPDKDVDPGLKRTDAELFPKSRFSMKAVQLKSDEVNFVQERSDPDSTVVGKFEWDKSGGERSNKDVENSIAELRENPLYESNETLDEDSRNGQFSDNTMCGVMELVPLTTDFSSEVLDQENVFISNEQEILPGQVVYNDNEKLSFSPRVKPTVPHYDFGLNKSTIQTTEKSENVEAVEAGKNVEVLERRSTLASVVEDMESQVTESKLESREDHVKINVHMPIATPVATISAISHILWEDILQQVRRSTLDSETKSKNGVYLSKKKVQYAEKVLHKALVEFYRGLGLLKSYSSLNMMAFAKILKKFDKVMENEVAPIYLKAVENSYFSSSDRVVRLMEKVEKLFTKYFQANDRRKAMALLRPTQQKSSHRVSFLIGLFTGGSVALVGVLAIIAPTTLWRYKSGRKSGEQAYYDSVFPLFSMMALILVHMYMYGCDVYLWRRMHINYAFIFEFSPGNVLRYREMFLLCTCLTCLYLGIMVGHIAGHYSKRQPNAYFDFLPATLLMIFFLLLLCPFNFCYRSSRAFFLRTLLHIVCAPLYKVVLADFFLADQLTSQVPSFRQLEYVLCYYIGSYYERGNGDACTKNKHFQHVVYLVSLAPYWWRFAQCCRRYIDERDTTHIANCGKYFSAMLAMGLKITYSGKNKSKGLLAMTILSSIAATATQLYWDIVMDWGLLRRGSKNPWLRDSLILHEYKYVYYTCMALNLVLRLAWLQSVARWELGNLDHHMTEFIFAGLEIIRRGMWNFFRIENEHLNNIGKFRAVKTVPLPFEELRVEEP